MFGWKDNNEVYEGTNVIEICKDRESGNQDIFIPLWYELQTKRLKNTEQENIVYSWKKPDKDPEQLGFITFDDSEDIPFY